jgi:hypothetical protein
MGDGAEMESQISEFSYGYALTDCLVNAHGLRVVGAPEFPSHRAEGSIGGGYDVRIPFHGIPIFLQFKLSEFMKGPRARKLARLDTPFYRMCLSPRKYSKQHDLLLALERTGKVVFYAAPEFHTEGELNQEFCSRSVVDRTAFFSPLAIGALPDEDEHCIEFRAGAESGFLRSARQRVSKRLWTDIFDKQVRSVLDHRSALVGADAVGFLWALCSTMVSIYQDIIGGEQRDADIGRRISRAYDNDPEKFAAYLSSVVFGCALLLPLARARP